MRPPAQNLVQIGTSQEYIRSVAKPAAIGIALGAITLVAYLLFFIISLCFKCCSNERGCCQRAQAASYLRRLPFVFLVAAGAVIGLIGGIIVLSAVPTFVEALEHLIADQLQQVRFPSYCIGHGCLL
jgi:hypothetical protein